ncbi:hypothetical protein [Heliobacterium mobile]|nr:hypothetical protein [Heliobacterium mobile]
MELVLIEASIKRAQGRPELEKLIHAIDRVKNLKTSRTKIAE